MGLVGTLPTGIIISKIPLCQFEGDRVDANGDIAACDGEPRYRVTFVDGTSWNACEEHAQQLWDHCAADQPVT